jgi:hypothetical protein
VTAGEGEFASAGIEAEAEGVATGVAELGGLVLAVGFGAGEDDVAGEVGLAAVADGDVVGAAPLF